MTPLLAILALCPLAFTGDSVSDAIAAALAVPGARAEVRNVRITAGSACRPARAEVLRPVSGSGEIPLRLTGAGPDGRACEAFGWASVRVTATALILSRAVATGEPLQDAVTQGEIELRSGQAPLAELPAGARAARALAAGAPVLASDVRTGPAPGEPITVLVRAGGLEITQAGRALPCPRGRSCALLPGGRRVEGRFEDGRLVLEVP
jgi:flagella basal body P-ring formation protein FlgA